ncbi:uncharacterized protein [Panulirus ornatus]|uniref:uncharacterized protein n=1 Tax=Panulirus ornatus TaxID=150431 RepID=UPI003A849011
MRRLTTKCPFSSPLCSTGSFHVTACPRRGVSCYPLLCSALPSAPLLHQRVLVYVLLVFLLGVTPGASGVLVQNVRVPSPAIVGQSAQLECLWEEGAKGFYSVRWYKNGEQFYSYVPKNMPQVKVDHHLPGVRVMLSHSNEKVVTLGEVRMDSEGVYRCEVMSEAPKFETAFASSNLTVVVMPERPRMAGLRDLYTVGDLLNLTCTARDARPSALLSFLVNGVAVPPRSGHVWGVSSTEGSYGGVYTSSSRLLLPLGERHVPSVMVQCRAQVLSLFTHTNLTALVRHPPSPILSFFNTGAAAGPACLLVMATLTYLLTTSSSTSC